MDIRSLGRYFAVKLAEVGAQPNRDILLQTHPDGGWPTLCAIRQETWGCPILSRPLRKGGWPGD